MQRNEENKRKNEKKEGCKAKGDGEGLPWYEMLKKKNYPTKTKKKYIDTKTAPFKERRNLQKPKIK